MYDPIKDGIEKNSRAVQYLEAKPNDELSSLVHSFWELKTDATLSDDFVLHAIPDACVNILLNLKDVKIAGITALHTTYETLNLGKSFHYVGIQFLPGVWQGGRDEIVDRFVGTPYKGSLPLVETSNKLVGIGFSEKQSILAELVRQLVLEGLVVRNIATQKILTHIDDIHTVADMAATVGMSPRQLQRTLKQAVGFTPHDFLKVLRLQKSFGRNYLESYTDQSHFIHSFQKITGYTPAQYFSKFDV